MRWCGSISQYGVCIVCCAERETSNFNVPRVLINVHLLVNELCEYQNAQCNDKNCGIHLHETEIYCCQIKKKPLSYYTRRSKKLGSVSSCFEMHATMSFSWYRKTSQCVKLLTKSIKYQSGFALPFNVEDMKVSG